MQRKGNPPALLIGMQIGTATMENSTKVPQKTAKLPYGPAALLFGIYPEKTTLGKDTYKPIFIAVLLTTAKK